MKTNEPVVICGTDFSEPAANAARLAANIATLMGGKLVLLHAAEHPGVIAEPPEVGQAFVNAQSAELHAQAEELRSLGAEVEEAFAFGPADKALVDTAAERHAQLIVVAAVGRTRRLLMGSLAVRTAETSPVPTLVVRQPHSLESWTQGEHTLRILLADDFSVSSEAALRFVATLMELAPCDVTALHVNWPPEERARLGLRGPLSLTENEPEVQQSLEQTLRRRTRDALGARACKRRVMPCWGCAEGHILAAAAEMHADLIVLGTHQRRLIERFRLGSISRAVLHDALVSVLVVPMPAKVRATKKARRRKLELSPV